MQNFLTIDDVMSRYKISRTGLYFKCNNGTLPRGVKIGRSRRWRLSDLEEFEKQFKSA